MGKKKKSMEDRINVNEKGNTFERTCCKILKELYPDAKRGYQYRGAKKDHQPDIIGTSLWIECKAGRKINVKKAIDQAIRDTDDRDILVIYKDDYQPIKCVLEFKEDLWPEFDIKEDDFDYIGLLKHEGKLYIEVSMTFFIDMEVRHGTKELNPEEEMELVREDLYGIK